jgi:hypothetical protein
VGVCGVWGCGVVGVWGCGVTPYVRHSTDCTCCDFGHLRFYNFIVRVPCLESLEGFPHSMLEQ